MLSGSNFFKKIESDQSSPASKNLNGQEDIRANANEIKLTVTNMENFLDVAARARDLADNEAKIVEFVFNNRLIRVKPGTNLDEIQDQFEPGYLEKGRKEKFLINWSITEEGAKKISEEIKLGKTNFPANSILPAAVFSGIISDSEARELMRRLKDQASRETAKVEVLDLMRKIKE